MDAAPAPESAAREGVLPTFVIVGVPKAGTSSLSRWLAAHPQVFMSADKELHYFDWGYDQGEAWYRRQFAGARDDGIVAAGEASPTYVLKDHWLARMTTDLPTARAILLLRHPVDRAYSHYWYQRSLGFEKRSFEQAVRDELRAPDDQPFRHLGDGRYGPILHRLDQHVPDDRRLVLLFDDLRADAEGTFGSVCRFIGVDHDRAPEEVGAVVNATTMLRSEWLREQMLRWHAWRRLPFGIADRIDRLNRLETRYPPMPAALRRELVAWFADDVAETAAHLGRDLSAWTS